MLYLGGSVVKNLPAAQEMQVPSLGQEDPLEKEMATHSSILAWKIPWTEEPAGKGLILPGVWNHVVFLELRRDFRVRRGSQASFWVGPGKPNLPL